MAWTEITRAKYRRNAPRYASDLTEAEWAVVSPLCRRIRRLDVLARPHCERSLTRSCTSPRPAANGGRCRKSFRPILRSRSISTVGRVAGVFAAINHPLVMMAREAAGREASPTAGVIDSQSLKTVESGGPRGFDAGKKIKGRKLRMVTDTQGNLVASWFTKPISRIATVHRRCFLYPWLRHIFADGGYAGTKMREALEKNGTWALEIIKRCDDVKGFVTRASGHAERLAALAMIERRADRPTAVTLGELRSMNVRPHIARNTTRRSAIDAQAQACAAWRSGDHDSPRGFRT